MKVLKERFGQELRLADESSDRIRSIHSNTHLEQITLLRQMEQDTLASLVTKHQQEIDEVIQVHNRELEKTRIELENNFETWKKSIQIEVCSVKIIW
jgi:hypothetical protein